MKILLLIGDLALTPSFTDSKSLLESLKKNLTVEVNHKVKAQFLLTLGLIAKNLHGKDTPVLSGITAAVREALKDTNHFVRRTGLKILG